MSLLSAAGWATAAKVATVGATIYAGKKGADAAKESSAEQVKAADRALEVFEKNAGLSQDILEESTNTAINTLRGGSRDAADILKESSGATIETLTKAAGESNKLISTAAGQVEAGLKERKYWNRDGILQAYGIQKDAINSSAIAASGVINAAREKAVNSITSGYAAGRADVIQGRDLVNKVLQDSTRDANEKLQIARAGAIAAQDRGLAAIRSDYQPFLDAGKLAIDDVQKLIRDPAAQKAFIENNPFFDSLAKNAETRLLSNQAASGRVGSGSTQKELHNELLLLGNSLLDNTINQRLGLVQTGMQATGQVAGAETNRANSVATIEQQTGRSLADLAAQLGINQGNNETGAARSLTDLSVGQGRDVATTEGNAASRLAEIEQGRGRDISTVTGQGIERLVSSNNTLDLARADNLTNSTGIIANTNNNLGVNVAKAQSQTGVNLSNLATATTDAEATLQSNLGINKSNILTNQAANTADTLIGQGDAKAAGIVGKANALTGTLSDLNKIFIPMTDEEERKRRQIAAGGDI